MEIGGEESWGNGYGPAKHLPREQGLVQAKVEVAQVHVLTRVHARAGAEFRGSEWRGAKGRLGQTWG